MTIETHRHQIVERVFAALTLELDVMRVQTLCIVTMPTVVIVPLEACFPQTRIHAIIRCFIEKNTNFPS